MSVSEVKGNFVVIWLDKDVKKTRDSQDTQALLRQAARKQLEVFDDPDDCVSYIITEQSKRVFLIVSGAFGRYVVPMIHQIPQIHTVYVFCVNRQRAEEWIKPYLKVSGIFTDKKNLVEKIRDDIVAYDEDSHLPMSVFHLEDREKSVRNLNEESAAFMWYRLLMVVLQRLAISPSSKTEMIAECRLTYHKDPVEQEKINKFEREYESSKAIWWYTSDCFVYRLLNKALRMQNVDAIFRFRFFIQDLNKQIKGLYRGYVRDHQPISEHHLTVYRGQHMTVNELELLKNNINGLISMNSFLSATLNKNLALIFAETETPCTETSSVQSVLFIIDIFDMSDATTPFAPIKSYSCYQEEDEVLFTIGAIFKVKSIEWKGSMWEALLQLSKEENQLCENLSKHFIKQIGDEASPLALGWFLYRMNDFSKAERYTKSLLQQLSDNARDKGKAYNLLGLIKKDTGHVEEAIDCYEEALKSYVGNSPPDSPHVIATHYNLGLAYLSLGNNEKAAEHQQNAEKQLINSSQTNNQLLIAMSDSLKAKLETAVGNYDVAFKNLEDVLKTKRKTLPHSHASIASTLLDMGVVQEKMGDYNKALEYFTDALNIRKKTLQKDHIDIATCHIHIGHLYNNRQEYACALKEFETALDIIKDVTRDHVELVEDLQKYIRDAQEKIKSKK